MSGGIDSLQLRQDDVIKFLTCQSHLGSNTVDFQMEHYIWKRRPEGQYIINVRKTWEKVLFAARTIAAVENPADVCIISARPYGQRGILKFSAHTGATAVAGRFTPGTFTNQIQKAYREPRLLIAIDPHMDHQAITEASYVNIPVIALCNTDSRLKMVDIAIPCNNKSPKSIGLMLWMLSREILILRGQTTRHLDEKAKFILDGKEIMADLYFYRDPEEAEKEQIETEKAKDVEPTEAWGQEIGQAGQVDQWTAGAGPLPAAGGITDFQPAPMDWAEEAQRAAAAQNWKPAPAAAPVAPAPAAPQGADEWGGSGGGGW